MKGVVFALCVAIPALVSASSDTLSSFNVGVIVASGDSSNENYEHDIVIHAKDGKAYLAHASGYLSHPLMRAHPVNMLVDMGIVETHVKEVHYHGFVCAGKANVCLRAEWHPIPMKPTWVEAMRFRDAF
jgi:hypothetical protein